MKQGCRMEPISDQISVCVSDFHRFGTDAFLLTAFSGYRSSDLVCELGTGCGIIALMMHRCHPPKQIYAVDIQEDAIEQLKAGIDFSHISGITPVCADLKTLWQDAPLGRCSLVICNPPYMRAGSGEHNTLTAQTIARHEVLCTIDDVCASAKRLLKYGGRLCLCNRPDRLCDVLCAMRQNEIEPKRIRFVAKNSETAPWLVLVEGKRGAKPSLRVEPPLYIRDGDAQSEEINRLYRSGTFL